LKTFGGAKVWTIFLVLVLLLQVFTFSEGVFAQSEDDSEDSCESLVEDSGWVDTAAEWGSIGADFILGLFGLPSLNAKTIDDVLEIVDEQAESIGCKGKTIQNYKDTYNISDPLAPAKPINDSFEDYWDDILEDPCPEVDSSGFAPTVPYLTGGIETLAELYQQNPCPPEVDIDDGPPVNQEEGDGPPVNQEEDDGPPEDWRIDKNESRGQPAKVKMETIDGCNPEYGYLLQL